MDSEPSIWSRIFEYGWALLPYWWLIVPGGVFAVEPMMEAFVPRKWQESIDRYWPKERRHQHFRMASIVALFIASFLAFDDISSRNRSLSKELAAVQGKLHLAEGERDEARQQLAEKAAAPSSQPAEEQTKYVCTISISAKTPGRSAMLFEFGVRGFSTNGFAGAVEIDRKISSALSWEGIPLRTDIPPRMGGVYTMSSSQIEGDIYRRSFASPQLTPQKSEYIYIEAENAFNVRAVLFLEDFDAMSDQIKANKLASAYETCPR